jgi:hypothetical protein
MPQKKISKKEYKNRNKMKNFLFFLNAEKVHN